MLVTHTYSDMITARMMAIAAGYEDADDLDTLRRNPALMIACDRAPESGTDLPIQPTISRLENPADMRTVIRRIRKLWPNVAILVRGDGHYCAPETLDLARKMDCRYSFALPRNAVLDRMAEPWRERCWMRWKPDQARCRRFHTFTIRQKHRAAKRR